MPNFNNEPFLKEAIESILNQDYKNFVFLIIDDGSTDKSIEIIESFDDPRIKLIKKEKNTGIVDSLNIGLREINSKYYIRMDADDISLPYRFTTLINFMEKNPEIGVCSSYLELFGETQEIWKQELKHNKILSKFIYSTGIAHAPSIIRSNVLKNNQIEYRKTHPHLEDYDLFFRLKNLTKMATIDQVLYKYRIGKNNVTVQNRSTQNLRYKEIYKEVLTELEIEPNEKNLCLHLEYFLNEPINSKISALIKHRNKIISKNLTLAVYPQKELVQILDEKWEYIFYKIAPNSMGQVIAYFYFGKKIKMPQLIYLIKIKFNQLIKRK